MVKSIAHGMRVAGAAIVAGMLAGAAAGLGARVVMFVIRLMNPSYNGQITHAQSEVGRWTAAGTIGLVIEGVFVGVSGGLVYAVVRRWMPGRGAIKGVSFGILLLLIGGGVVIDGSYEFYRYVSTWVSVSLFALLFVLYGVVVAPLAEWIGHGEQRPPRVRAIAIGGYVVIGAVVAWATVRAFVGLRDTFHIFG